MRTVSAISWSVQWIALAPLTSHKQIRPPRRHRAANVICGVTAIISRVSGWNIRKGELFWRAIAPSLVGGVSLPRDVDLGATRHAALEGCSGALLNGSVSWPLGMHRRCLYRRSRSRPQGRKEQDIQPKSLTKITYQIKGSAALLHPTFLVSFPRIPFPETNIVV